MNQCSVGHFTLLMEERGLYVSIPVSKCRYRHLVTYTVHACICILALVHDYIPQELQKVLGVLGNYSTGYKVFFTVTLSTKNTKHP